MDSEKISATEAATVAATVATSESRIEIVSERRPAYSAAFRARVVAESSGPGVRAPDLAHRYGIHVSVIYRWRRMAKAQTMVTSPVPSRRQRPDTVEAAAEAPVTFIPLGIVGPPKPKVAPSTEARGTSTLGMDMAKVSRRPRGAFRGATGMSDRASSRSTWRAARRYGWMRPSMMGRSAACWPCCGAYRDTGCRGHAGLPGVSSC
jgi:transposase-like protein